jgi:hypothetical protein
MASSLRTSYLMLVTWMAWSQPLVMLLFALLWSGLEVEAATSIPAFMDAGSNTHRINLLVFLPFASLLCLAWLRVQVAMFAARRPRFSASRFLKAKIKGNLPGCAVGGLNLLAFSAGMEGNVFGFLFVLPLAVVSLASVIIWIVLHVRAHRGAYDAPAPGEQGTGIPASS